MMATNGLQRIFLVDSFIAGRRVVVDLDGHATINGANGSGKTTFLRLLPIFYGATPSQVESRAGGKTGFVDYYLPRSTSLIVFEYLREDGPRCVILYRHPSVDTSRIAYRFLHAGFMTDYFAVSGDNGEPVFCKGKELRTHWSSKGLEQSHQIDVVTDYRAIIQNDTALLRRTTSPIENRRIARKFSLGDGVGVMQHMEKVCTAIQTQHGNIEKMKDMLGDIMLREGVTIPNPPTHPDNIQLSNRIHWLKEFETELPSIKNTLDTHVRYLEIQSQLGTLSRGLRSSQAVLEEQVSDLEKEFAALQGDLRELTNNWESIQSELHSQSSQHAANVETTDASIQGLISKNDEYEEIDIASKMSQYNDLTRLKSLLSQARSRVDSLSKEVTAEKLPFDQQDKEERERHRLAIQHLVKQKEALNNEINSLKDRYREKETVLNQQRNQALDDRRAEADPQRDELVSNMADAKADARNSARTDEEQARLKAITDGIARIRRELDASKEEVTHAHEQAQAAKKELDHALDFERDILREIDERQAECDRLRGMLYPDDGTWLSNLRSVDPSWTEKLGKLVNPELLTRKDLSPDFVEVTDSFYGWAVDYSVLTAVEAAQSEEALRSGLTDTESKLSDANKRLVEAKKRSKKAADNHTERFKILGQIQARERAVDTRFRQQLERHQIEDQKISDDAADRKRKAKVRAEELGKRLQSFDNRLREDLQNIKSSFNESLNEIKSTESIELSQLQQSKNQIIKNERDESEKHQQFIKQIWSDFKALCSDKGIDTETLNEAESQAKQVKEKVSTVEGYAALITDYREWRASQWVRLEGLNEELQKETERLRETQAKLESEKARFREEEESCKHRQRDIHGRLISTRNLLLEIEDALRPIGKYPPSDIPDEQGEPRYLLQMIQETFEVFQKIEAEVSNGIRRAEIAIIRADDDTVKKSWQELVTTRASSLGKDFQSDPNYWQHLPPLLEQFLDEIVPNMRQALIELIRGVGSQLSEFFHGLHEADRKISNYSTKISRKIVDSIDIDALSNVEIRLASKVSGLEYWVDLKLFVHEWDEWNSARTGELPSLNLADAMGQALEAINKVRSTTDLKKLFDLTLQITENDRPVEIKNDNDLENASSTGLSYLALCGIFIGMTHYLCDKRKTAIHWPVDELGVFDGDNIGRLFGMLDRADIVMVSAFPSDDPNLIRRFKHHHVIDRYQGIRIVDPQSTDLAERLKAKLRNSTQGEPADV